MLFALTFITILGCGLVAGIFFAFSTFVIKALGELPPSKGIATMQSINTVVMNPLFLGVFMGTAADGLESCPHDCGTCCFCLVYHCSCPARARLINTKD